MYMSAGGGISLPFTAIGAESLSSTGPLHCAAPPNLSSLRPESEDQAEMDPADMEDVEEVEEEETGEDENSKARQLTVQMMQNPQILAALQERLDGLNGSPSGYMESLPKVVKRRVNALKNLQVKCAHIEAKFYEEVHELERKYAALYQPLFDKRSDIVKAAYEPTDEECEWKADEEEELTDEMKEKAKLEEEKKDEEKEDPKGIPEFWLTVFKNVDLLSDMLQEHDEPILKHLQDIKVKFSDPGQPMGKNVTLKTIKKKQKHKGRGTVRTVTKTVPNDSFFNFFTPPEVPENGELRIVPRAVLYFTGEAIEDDDDDYDEEGEEADDEEGEEEADEENDPDYDPKDALPQLRPEATNTCSDLSELSSSVHEQILLLDMTACSKEKEKVYIELNFSKI
ncbi:hypothetical protein INR49_021832 [Caranx melampygus]|nr:hypothetical protein INR49_021832 [Caranx melampygus]